MAIPVPAPSRFKYQSEIQSMMYTFGDVRSSNPAASELIEDLVHQHVVQLAVDACHVAQRRGSRFMNVEDVIFNIRHDVPQVNRIIDFLSWKDVRKNVKQASAGPADEAEVVEEEEKLKQPKRKKVKLSYDFVQTLTDVLKEDDVDDDEESVAVHYAEIAQRLKEADEVTKSMTREEYFEYAECRQASFTYKKGKRFRDWLNLSAFIDMKPNDEILEILGYISWEIVNHLTRMALLVKNEWELFQTKQKKTRSFDREKVNRGLFAVPDEKTPILAEHLREAYRRMQANYLPFHVFAGHRILTKANVG